MSETRSTCSSCNAPLVAGARFCEKCGRPATPSGAGSPPPLPVTSPSAPVCPKCGQKEKAFTAAEFLKKTFTPEEMAEADRKDITDPEGVQMFYLEKPSKPVAGNLAFWLVLPFIPILNFILCWFAPIHKGYKFFMAGILLIFWVCALVPALHEMAAYAFVGCFFVLFYYAALFIDRDRQNVLLTTQELPAYQKAVSRWEHLCYCQTCDISWLSTQPGQHVPVEETEKLLKS